MIPDLALSLPVQSLPKKYFQQICINHENRTLLSFCVIVFLRQQKVFFFKKLDLVYCRTTIIAFSELAEKASVCVGMEI